MSVRIASGRELRHERVFINPYNGTPTTPPGRLGKDRPYVATTGINPENPEGEATENTQENS
jgi:hypothetical protein